MGRNKEDDNKTSLQYIDFSLSKKINKKCNDFGKKCYKKSFTIYSIKIQICIILISFIVLGLWSHTISRQ